MAQALASSLLKNDNRSADMSSTNEMATVGVVSQVESSQEGNQHRADDHDTPKTKHQVENTVTAGNEDDAAMKDIAISKTAIHASQSPVNETDNNIVAGSIPTLPSFQGNNFLTFNPVVISPGEMQWDQLVGGSILVFLTDRNLVPDSLFVSMAQMEPCQLGELDRCGAYKSREIGFTGLKCKYCHGQPGFGRYFPASVRSLAQTTTSQTIIKHIAQRCQYCPPYVRAAVVELERQHEETAKSSEKAKKPHGGRKLFFERIWSRLHGVSLTDSAKGDAEKPGSSAVATVDGEAPDAEQGPAEPDKSQPNNKSQPTTTDNNFDESEKLNNAALDGDDASSEDKKGLEVSFPLKKRKYLFRSLPTQKRKNRSEGSSSVN